MNGLPFSYAYSPGPSIGEVLLALVFNQNIFQCSGLGVFRQRVGFSMGMMSSPAWMNLILHAYEESYFRVLPDEEKQQRGFVGRLALY